MTNETTPPDPRIECQSGFLTPAECSALIEEARERVAPHHDPAANQGDTWGIEDWSPVVGRVVSHLGQHAARWQLRVDQSRLAVIRYVVGQRIAVHRDWSALSLTVQLSGPDDYGGGLLLLDAGDRALVAPREAGTCVTFGGNIAHEVTPVTAGERWALVGWAYGPGSRPRGRGRW